MNGLEQATVLGSIILLSGFAIGYLVKMVKGQKDESKINEKSDRDLTDPISDVIKRQNESRKS
jgi:hypothetical protein